MLYTSDELMNKVNEALDNWPMIVNLLPCMNQLSMFLL